MTKEERREYNKQWRDNHLGYDKHYNDTHKEERKEHRRKRYLKNKEQENEYNRNYYRTHKEEHAELGKRWNKEHPERRRELWRKCSNKRERNLGYIPINNWFEGSNFHHLDKDSGVYIPEWLHKAYWHNQWTGQGMDKINEVAIYWWMINQCKQLQGGKK